MNAPAREARPPVLVLSFTLFTGERRVLEVGGIRTLWIAQTINSPVQFQIGQDGPLFSVAAPPITVNGMFIRFPAGLSQLIAIAPNGPTTVYCLWSADPDFLVSSVSTV